MLGGSHCGQPTPKGAGINAPSPWGQKVYMNYLEFFFTKICDFSPIYLFHRLFIWGWNMNIYFILWVIMQYCAILWFRLSQLWSSGALSDGSRVPATHAHHYPSLWFLCSALPHFLVLQDAPCSPYIFPTPVLESAISPRNPGSFCWRMILETKI